MAQGTFYVYFSDKRAIEAGEVAPLDPETLAWCLTGIGDFLGMRWVLWEERDLPDHVLDTMTALIHHGMAGSGARAVER